MVLRWLLGGMTAKHCSCLGLLEWLLILLIISVSKSMMPVCQAFVPLCKEKSIAPGCLILHLLLRVALAS